jgi:hypothetical protein
MSIDSYNCEWRWICKYVGVEAVGCFEILRFVSIERFISFQDVLSSNLSLLSWLRVFIFPQFLRNTTAPLEKAIIIIIIIIII